MSIILTFKPVNMFEPLTCKPIIELHTKAVVSKKLLGKKIARVVSQLFILMARSGFDERRS